jgi:molecular chaperone DnaJ
MASKNDYYDTLGVSKSASKDEIKSAYRKLAKTYHPDNKETGNEAKFKEIQEAYDVLYDDQKRSTYDQFGHAAFDQTGGGAGGNPFQGGFGGFGGDGVDLGDIFSSFFGGGPRTRQPQNGPRRGNDTIQRIRIDFMDAINGKDIEINLELDEKCTRCGGTGARTPNDIKMCPHCNGRGYIRVQRPSLFGTVTSEEVCPNCNGSGKIVTDRCPECNGKGYNRKKVKLPIHIPAGINNGQQIRKQGYGERGLNGGPNGDFYVEILVKPHEHFKREGNNIHINIPVDVIDACLGVEIDVPTVYGDKTITVPSGTQPGQILRMKGCGVKDLRTGKPGDQFVHLDLKVPTNISKEQKDLLNKFKSSSKEKESLFSKFKKAFKK